MKKTIGAILLLVQIVAAQSVICAQGKETTGDKAEIAKIQKYREEGERKLVENKFTRKEVALTGDNIKETIKQKWAKMAAYYEGSKLVRIQLYPHDAVSGRSEEFYLLDNKLVFAFIQDKGPKQEGNDMGQPGKELYFHNDKLIKLEDRSGEPPANHPEQERKMYETRLPFEISELLDILKKG